MKRRKRWTTWRPVRTLAAGILALTLSFQACSTVPITGRQQLNLIPSSTMLGMSSQQYGQFLQQHRLSRNSTQTAMVKRVGGRIATQVENYFRQEGLSSQLKGYKWEFNLIESEEENAWAMPGGKVVVYSGILPITRSEAGLAAVMGHEIAHAVAEHGNERMSQGLLTQLGGVALSEALKTRPQATRQLWMTAFGVGATYGALLPFSRTQENEADRLGSIFMAMAGYNPNEAVRLWERMASARKGGSPPEFMSTHPSDETRIRRLKQQMPEAMEYYASR